MTSSSRRFFVKGMQKLGLVLFVIGVLGLIVLMDIAIYNSAGTTALLIAIFLELISGGIILALDDD